AVTLGAVASWRTDVPLVVARRVDFPLHHNLLTRWKYDRAAAVIAVSQAVADVVTKSGIDASRVVVVPDGTDLRRDVKPSSADTLGSLGLSTDRPLVVQIAQLVGHKD